MDLIHEGKFPLLLKRYTSFDQGLCGDRENLPFRFPCIGSVID